MTEGELLLIGFRRLKKVDPMRFGMLFGTKKIPENESGFDGFLLDEEIAQELICLGEENY